MTLPIKLTARQRLETWSNISRIQPDEETYDLERTVVGSVAAGVAADRCGQCGACDRALVPMAVGDRKDNDMAIDAALAANRPCTCHPDDNPPRPCPQKFALSECRVAALAAKDQK